MACSIQDQVRIVFACFIFVIRGDCSRVAHALLHWQFKLSEAGFLAFIWDFMQIVWIRIDANDFLYLEVGLECAFLVSVLSYSFGIGGD